ncbi:MFS general substrate transporter, partial [Aureobasidium melanogenum]
MSDLKKPDVEEIEKIYEHGSSDVQLIVNNETVLLPIPSEDPKDPLNLPPWRKWAILVIVSAFSCSAAVLASGLGPIFPMIVRDYPGQELKANDLQTYPTLFMGIGNMLSLPITNVVGRRSIFLASIILLIVGGIWCAYSQSLESHIAGRMVMSLAAGQSEALSPMIVQEIHFLHERGRKLGWFIFIQNFTVGIFFFSETYMVSAWGWRWWYGFLTIFNAVVFLLAFPLASETLWIRPDAATEGVTGVDTGIDLNELTRVTTAHGNTIRPDIYGPRTWRSDLKLFTKGSSWDTVPVFYLDLLKGFCHPTLFWLLVLNGAYLGLYIFQASTFAGVLLKPPYSMTFNNLGYVQGAQILVCIGFLPLLGYGSDLVIKFMSQRNNGTYKPEYRLLLLVIPGISTLICAIIYGQAAQYPAEWNRLAVAFPYNFIFFGFLGANIVGITYGIDSFPLKAAPVLVVICAGRGLISFGLSYAVLPSIAALGYDGIMNILGGLTAGITVLAIPIYFFGPYLRRLGRIYYGFGESKTHHGAH